jgi:heat shock protein HslJ
VTEEEKERMEEEVPQGEAPQEELTAVEAEETESAEKAAEGGKKGWPVAAIIIAAILALFTLIVCIATAVALFSRGGEETPMPTLPPAVTVAPSEAMIAITEPDQGQVVDIDSPVTVQGKGVGLTEGSVVVEALDWQGTVLDRQPTTLQGRDVDTGGAGTWSVELTIDVEPGTAGTIRAYSESPADGSIIAEDSVEVSLGRTAQAQAFITIDEPVQGAILDIAKPVLVRGSGAALPEANVVVEALDWQGNVLAQVPATLQGPDVGTGGQGTWSAELSIDVEPGTAGKIRAYSSSPADGSIVAEAVVDVSLGRTVQAQAFITIDEPVQGALLDIAKPVLVRGSGAALPEANVVVEALDWQGSVLAQVPATLQGPDVGTGGQGTWSVELSIDVEPGTAGKIRAYSSSPADGSIVAEDSVEVSLGQTPIVQSYIKIDAPQQGDAIDVTNLIQVSGTGAGLPEGNLVVVAVDDSGNVLDQQPITLQGADVGTGGEGTWSVELAVPASGQVPGYIAAFAASPKQRALIASDHVEVVFYGEYTLEGVTWLLDKTITGSEITAEFTAATATEEATVKGSAGCNTYTGTYVVLTRAIGRNRFEIGPLATTRMACDQSLMEQESLFLAAMEAATSYRIEGFALTIVYPGGELLFYDKNGPRPRR